jgi:hypothetical protein
MPLEGEFGNLRHCSIGRMPGDCNLLSLDASPAIPTCVFRFEVSVLHHRTPVRRCSSPVRLVRPTGQIGLELLRLRVRLFNLDFWINQGTQWYFSEPLETLRTRCSLHQSPLMTRLQRSPGSTLVLRLNQETFYDFILLFMPPSGPHLTPLAIGSLERSLLVISTPGGHTSDDLSHLFFTCTKTSQATTCTCIT